MTTYTDFHPVTQFYRQHKSQIFYNTVFGAAGATAAVTQGDLRLCCVHVPNAGAYDRVQIELVTAGEAGAVTRLIWFETDEEYQTPKVAGAFVDFGTVATDTAAGAKSITINQHLARGVAWFGIVNQLCPTTPPTIRTVTTPATQGIYPTEASLISSFAGSGGIWQATGVTGAASAWAVAVVTAATVVPRIWIRRA